MTHVETLKSLFLRLGASPRLDVIDCDLGRESEGPHLYQSQWTETDHRRRRSTTKNGQVTSHLRSMTHLYHRTRSTLLSQLEAVSFATAFTFYATMDDD